MHHAAVVPNHHVARLPAVPPHTGRLAGERHQAAQEAFGVCRAEPDDAVGVAAHVERWAASDGMRLHQGTQRGFAVNEAVTGAHLHLVADLRLGVVERVKGGERRDALPHGFVQGIVGGAHVRPLGLPAGGGRNPARKHRCLGRHGHVGAIRVPTLVAAQNQRLVARVIEPFALGVTVADGHDVPFGHELLDVTETPSEGDLRLFGQVLVREDQHPERMEGVLDLAPVRRRQAGEMDAGDGRPQGRVSRLDGQRHSDPSLMRSRPKAGS